MTGRVVVVTVALATLVNVLIALWSRGSSREPDPPRLRTEPVKVGGAPALGPVDLLAVMNTAEDGVLGDWKRSASGALVSPSVPFARIYLPASLPDEYDLSLAVERVAGGNSFNIGLPGAGRTVIVAIDGWEGGEFSGLDQVDGKPFFDNPTTRRGGLLKKGQRRKVVCEVRRSGIRVAIDGAPLIEWKEGFARLSVYKDWQVAEPRAAYLGAWESVFHVHEAVVAPHGAPATPFR
jgi:hypothetical protein